MRKNNISNFVLISILLFSILASGCMSASEEEAEQIAVSFLQEKVKFYSTDENNTKDVPRATMEIIDKYKEGNYWNFIILVSSEIEGETKSAKMRVVVDAVNREVSSFDPSVE